MGKHPPLTVSQVTMNMKEMPSDFPARKLAQICGNSAVPHAAMLARPRRKDATSRSPHTQSLKYTVAQCQPQLAGHSTGAAPAVTMLTLLQPVP
jgi:hypothetical protein